QMKRITRNGLLGLMMAGLAACTGTVGGGNNSSGSAGSLGTGNTPGTGGTTGPTCVGVCTCTPGIPATSQIPRMTRLQYDTVVKELLGVTTLASASNQAPSSLLGEDSTGPLTDIQWNGYLSA